MQEWEDGVWKKLILYGEEWNGNDQTLLEYVKRWSSDISDLIDLNKTIYIYGGNGKISSIERKSWDRDKSEWYRSNYESFEYDQSDREILHTIETWLSWSDEWHIVRNNMSYDDNNNLLIYSEENWDNNGSVWVNSSLDSFAYDGSDRKISETKMHWNVDSSKYEFRSNYLYDYDGNGFVNSKIEQNWNSDSKQWEDYEREHFGWTPNGFLSYYRAQLKSGDNWVDWSGDELVVPGYYELYAITLLYGYYNNVTAINESEVFSAADFSLAQNFPNPFNPSTSINFRLQKSKNVKITVYNIQGQVVKELTNRKYSQGEHQVKWNGLNSSGSSVAAGLYFYSMQSASFNQVKRMLLIK